MEDILPECIGDRETWQRGQVGNETEQESGTECCVDGDSPSLWGSVEQRCLARFFSTPVFAAVAGKDSPGDHRSLP